MSNITATMTPDDDIIPEILVVLYNNMDEEEKASWSQEAALILIGIWSGMTKAGGLSHFHLSRRTFISSFSR